MYVSGESVPEDLVLAHMWFNIAAAIEAERDRVRRLRVYKYGNHLTLGLAEVRSTLRS